MRVHHPYASAAWRQIFRQRRVVNEDDRADHVVIQQTSCSQRIFDRRRRSKIDRFSVRQGGPQRAEREHADREHLGARQQ
jgi:hypothetical protein